MAQIFEYDESRTRERRKQKEARTQRSYRTSSPVTPIPPRASASSPGSVRVRVRHPRYYLDDTEYTELPEPGADYARLPTVPQSAIWQNEADDYEGEYEGENDLVVVPEFLPFLPSSLPIDELDTVPPDDANVHRDIVPARLTDYAVTAPSGATAFSFPVDIATAAFPLELAPGAEPQSLNKGFPLELAEAPEQKGTVNVAFPLEIEAFVHKGKRPTSGNHASFPLVWPDEPDGDHREHALLKGSKSRHADISELATNPPPVPIQPHRALAFHTEPSYADAVIEADTLMDDTLSVVPSQSTDVAFYETRVEDIVDVALTARARRLLRHEGTPAFIHSPLDAMRWWLLSPGRLEFLFWLGGALLLGMVMCVVLLMTGLGLGWMSFGHLTH